MRQQIGMQQTLTLINTKRIHTL